MKRIGLVLVACCFFALPAARAQVGAYAEFTASQLSAESSSWHYGSTFGAYYTAWHFPVLNFGIDARGSILGTGGSSDPRKVYSGLAGPRVILHLPILPLKPYAEGLVGVGHIDEGFGNTSSTAFADGLAAGADLTFFPRLDWRVVEYSYIRLPGGINENAFSTGLVFRIPIP